MQESNIIEADFEEIVEEKPDNKTEAKEARTISKAETVKALKNAINDGTLTNITAKRVRVEMGIFDSEFTKKKISESKRKSKRKAQKIARKMQRK